MKRFLALPALLLAGVGCGQAAGSEAASSTTTTAARTISGTMTLHGYDNLYGRNGGPCEGLGGYDDMRPGTQVVVKDGAGAVLATGRLGQGKAGSLGAGPTAIANWCEFSWSISNLPDSAFYEVEVSHRGGLTYSRAQLDSMGWTVAHELS